MTDHEPQPQPEPRPEPPRTPISLSSVVGGLILGVLASWILLAFLVLETNRGSDAWWGALAAAVVFAALVVPRRTRQAGAGLVLGLAVGLIVGAGACAAMVGSSTPVLG